MGYKLLEVLPCNAYSHTSAWQMALDGNAMAQTRQCYAQGCRKQPLQISVKFEKNEVTATPLANFPTHASSLGLLSVIPSSGVCR